MGAVSGSRSTDTLGMALIKVLRASLNLVASLSGIWFHFTARATAHILHRTSLLLL